MYNHKAFGVKKAARSKADIPDIHAEGIEELREAFDLFDTKKGGTISLSELVDSMQSLGFHDKNPMMFEMMLKISTKRNGGTATFVQFAEDLAELVRDNKQERDLRMVFHMLDTEHTGRIKLENLKKIATEFGDTTSDAELLEMLDTAKHFDPEGLGDADEPSNEVSFHDFYHLMTRGKVKAGIAAATGSSPTGRPTHQGHGVAEGEPGHAL